MLEVARSETQAFITNPPRPRSFARRGRLPAAPLAAALRPRTGGLIARHRRGFSQPPVENFARAGDASDAGPAARIVVRYFSAAHFRLRFPGRLCRRGRSHRSAEPRRTPGNLHRKNPIGFSLKFRENLAALGLESRAEVFVSNAVPVLERVRADIVFLDPAYELEKEYDAALTILGNSAAGLVIAQHSIRLAIKPDYGCLRMYREIRQATMLSFYFVHRRPGPAGIISREGRTCFAVLRP